VSAASVVATEPKTPRKTASQKRADAMAERHDAWKSAHALLKPLDWAEGLTPYDVFQLAQWLAGDIPD
jgi:hypothetical protein